MGGTILNRLLLGASGEEDFGAPRLDADRIGAGRGRGDNMSEGVHAVAAAIASGFGGALGHITGRRDAAPETRVSVVGGGPGHGERDGTQGGQGDSSAAIVLNRKRHHRSGSGGAILYLRD